MAATRWQLIALWIKYLRKSMYIQLLLPGDLLSFLRKTICLRTLFVHLLKMNMIISSGFNFQARCGSAKDLEVSWASSLVATYRFSGRRSKSAAGLPQLEELLDGERYRYRSRSLRSVDDSRDFAAVASGIARGEQPGGNTVQREKPFPATDFAK